MQDSGS